MAKFFDTDYLIIYVKFSTLKELTDFLPIFLRRVFELPKNEWPRISDVKYSPKQCEISLDILKGVESRINYFIEQSKAEIKK